MGTWSFLAFVAVGAWLFMIHMPGRSHQGPLPLPTAEEAGLQGRLQAHVRRLAGEIGERNLGRPEALDAAARSIEGAFRDVGYAVASQDLEVDGRTVRNLEAEKKGASHPEEIVLVGSHYDSVAGSPGANDNATGVAANLETARLLQPARLARSVRFVAFVNEEPPFFQTEAMGSRAYARRSRQRGERITAMLSLETIGCYSDDPGSQHYPFPFGLFYPSRGNFVGFVGNTAARDLVRRAIGSFRGHTAFPSEGLAAPGFITGISWSDHWAFWEAGYPAIMVTDTALFRDPHYHSPEDTWDRVDYGRLARVVAGLARVVADLAGTVGEASPRGRVRVPGTEGHGGGRLSQTLDQVEVGELAQDGVDGGFAVRCKEDGGGETDSGGCPDLLARREVDRPTEAPAQQVTGRIGGVSARRRDRRQRPPLSPVTDSPSATS